MRCLESSVGAARLAETPGTWTENAACISDSSAGDALESPPAFEGSAE
jgi:hypothetical protein